MQFKSLKKDFFIYLFILEQPFTGEVTWSPILVTVTHLKKLAPKLVTYGTFLPPNLSHYPLPTSLFQSICTIRMNNMVSSLSVKLQIPLYFPSSSLYPPNVVVPAAVSVNSDPI